MKKRPPFPKAAWRFLQFDFTDAVARAAALAVSGWRGAGGGVHNRPRVGVIAHEFYIGDLTGKVFHD